MKQRGSIARGRRGAVRAGVAASTLALVGAAALLGRHDDGHVAASRPAAGAEPKAVAGPPAAGPDPGARPALQKLQRELARVPTRPRRWSRDGLVVLNEQIADETWRLAYRATPARTCLLLEVPHTTREGTCAPPDVLQRAPLLMLAGGKRDRKDPSRTTEYVVYGFVKDEVESLRMWLSDCSEPPLSLDTRPLVWTFVPRAKLARGVRPMGYEATLRGGERFRDGAECRGKASR